MEWEGREGERGKVVRGGGDGRQAGVSIKRMDGVGVGEGVGAGERLLGKADAGRG